MTSLSATWRPVGGEQAHSASSQHICTILALLNGFDRLHELNYQFVGPFLGECAATGVGWKNKTGQKETPSQGRCPFQCGFQRGMVTRP